MYEPICYLPNFRNGNDRDPTGARPKGFTCQAGDVRLKGAFTRTDAPFSFRLSPASPGRVGGLLPETARDAAGLATHLRAVFERTGQDDRHGGAEDWRIRQPGEDRGRQDRLAEESRDDADDDHGADHDDAARAFLSGYRHVFQRGRQLVDVAGALIGAATAYRGRKIGRANVWNTVTNAQLDCRLLLEKQT